jgi:hypothetical protein
MICERCGEVAETFMTEGHGELCEVCQNEVQQTGQPTKPPDRKRLADEL